MTNIKDLVEFLRNHADYQSGMSELHEKNLNQAADLLDNLMPVKAVLEQSLKARSVVEPKEGTLWLATDVQARLMKIADPFIKEQRDTTINPDKALACIEGLLEKLKPQPMENADWSKPMLVFSVKDKKAQVGFWSGNDYAPDFDARSATMAVNPTHFISLSRMIDLFNCDREEHDHDKH